MVRNPPIGDLGFICGLGRSPEEGNGNPLWYSCLENPTDRGLWWVTVHGVAESQTWLNNYCFLFYSLWWICRREENLENGLVRGLIWIPGACKDEDTSATPVLCYSTRLSWPKVGWVSWVVSFALEKILKGIEHAGNKRGKKMWIILFFLFLPCFPFFFNLSLFFSCFEMWPARADTA